MSREKKYRIWLGGYWRHWGFMRDTSGRMMFVGLPATNQESLSMEEMMERSQEYTGLKDKNGKEIWEGDILSNQIKPMKFNKGEADRMVVEWHDDLARFGLAFYSIYGGEGYTGTTQHIHEWTKEAIVIGNIYENPDLLK